MTKEDRRFYKWLVGALLASILAVYGVVMPNGVL